MELQCWILAELVQPFGRLGPTPAALWGLVDSEDQLPSGDDWIRNKRPHFIGTIMYLSRLHRIFVPDGNRPKRGTKGAREQK